MKRGDRVQMKDGTEGTITRVGMGDFFGDPFPVYLTTTTGKTVTLMSYELKAREVKATPARANQGRRPE